MFSIRNFSLALLMSLLAACGSSSGGPRNVEIDVSAILGGEPFACDRLFEGVGDSNATVDPIDLRLYVSEVELVQENGNAVSVDLAQDGEWQYQNVALLDFENGTGLCGQRGTPETNTTIRGTVPDGNYIGPAVCHGCSRDAEPHRCGHRAVSSEQDGSVVELEYGLQVYSLRYGSV